MWENDEAKDEREKEREGERRMREKEREGERKYLRQGRWLHTARGGKKNKKRGNGIKNYMSLYWCIYIH